MFRELQRSSLPNIPLLRGLIGWFDAVSDFLDDEVDAPTIYASGKVLAAGTFADGGNQRGGFNETIGHNITGIYNLALTTPVADVDLYVIHATLTYFGGTVDRVETISASFNGADAIQVQIRAVTDNAGTPAFAMVNHDFFVTVTKLLPPTAAVVGAPIY